MVQPQPQQPPTIRDITIPFPEIELTGDLEFLSEYHQLVLMTDEGPERISVDLTAYGYVPEPGHVFIKDWNEGHGVSAALETMGLAKRTRKFTVGPFALDAYEVQVLFGT